MNTNNNSTDKHKLNQLAVYQKLAKIQASATKVAKDAKANMGKGFSYSYEKLEDILGMLNPIIAEQNCGLIYTQKKDGEDLIIKVTLVDADGGGKVNTRIYMADWRSALRGGNSVQAMGSAISYCKRYAVKNLFNLNVGDDDDDAQSISTNNNKIPYKHKENSGGNSKDYVGKKHNNSITEKQVAFARKLYNGFLKHMSEDEIYSQFPNLKEIKKNGFFHGWSTY